MADEKKSGEHDKAKKHTLHAIHTRFTKDGAAIHEHHLKDHKGDDVAEKPEYVSSNMEDLQQHMQDHAAPAMAQGEQQEPADSNAPPDPGTAPAE